MSPRTILVVDDHQDSLHALAGLVEALGHRPLVASSGHEALGLLERGRVVGAVLTDFRMPDMDGIDLCEKARHVQPDVPVILVTGDPTGAEDVIRHGAIALLKPVTPDNLERVLQEALA